MTSLQDLANALRAERAGVGPIELVESDSSIEGSLVSVRSDDRGLAGSFDVEVADSVSFQLRWGDEAGASHHAAFVGDASQLVFELARDGWEIPAVLAPGGEHEPTMLARAHELLERADDEEPWCPVCRSGSIEGGSVTIEGTSAYQVVSCCDCDASWTEGYGLRSVMEVDACVAGVDERVLELAVVDAPSAGMVGLSWTQLESIAIALEYMADTSSVGDRAAIPVCTGDRSAAPLVALAARARALARQACSENAGGEDAWFTFSSDRSSIDGVPVVHVETVGMPENDRGPVCRVYLNDGALWANPDLPA